MKKYLARKVLLRGGCCVLAIMLIVAYMPLMNLYSFDALWTEIMGSNLKGLDEYPHVEAVYFRQKPYSIFYECAVYPYLDAELEGKIRDLGYPFNFFLIKYIGVDRQLGWPDHYTSNPRGIE